jgi:hypothetical protein
MMMSECKNWKLENGPKRKEFDKFASRAQGEFSSIDSFGGGWDAASERNQEIVKVLREYALLGHGKCTISKQHAEKARKILAESEVL